ncbi:MAG: hypothetical protein VW405_15490 [Rhodospirillaceae bacterium]
MRPTITELMKMLDERISEIQASKAPDMPEDIAAYQRWKGELEAMARRVGALAADVEA